MHTPCTQTGTHANHGLCSHGWVSERGWGKEMRGSRMEMKPPLHFLTETSEVIHVRSRQVTSPESSATVRSLCSTCSGENCSTAVERLAFDNNNSLLKLNFWKIEPLHESWPPQHVSRQCNALENQVTISLSSTSTSIYHLLYARKKLVCGMSSLSVYETWYDALTVGQ